MCGVDAIDGLSLIVVLSIFVLWTNGRRSMCGLARTMGFLRIIFPCESRTNRVKQIVDSRTTTTPNPAYPNHGHREYMYWIRFLFLVFLVDLMSKTHEYVCAVERLYTC
jgi:hypothetical protein